VTIFSKEDEKCRNFSTKKKLNWRIKQYKPE